MTNIHFIAASQGFMGKQWKFLFSSYLNAKTKFTDAT